MKKVLFGIISTMFLSNALASDENLVDTWKMPTPISFPGYTWGNFQFPNSVIKDTADYQNMVYQGKIEQGVVWAKFGNAKEFSLNTFADFNYTLDTRGLVYNNKILPGLGIKIQHQLADKIVSEYGVKVVYENQWKNGGGEGWGVQAFVNYWGGWDLKGN